VDEDHHSGDDEEHSGDDDLSPWTAVVHSPENATVYLSKMKVANLKAVCHCLHLSEVGTKAALLERLLLAPGGALAAMTTTAAKAAAAAMATPSPSEHQHHHQHEHQHQQHHYWKPSSFLNPPGSGCEDCPAGTYSFESDSLHCYTCRYGQFSPAGSTTCKRCVVGQFHPSTGESCRDCTAGQYQEWSGRTTCEHCPLGKFQTATGYGKCEDCAVGQWTFHNGATFCVPRPILTVIGVNPVRKVATSTGFVDEGAICSGTNGVSLNYTTTGTVTLTTVGNYEIKYKCTNSLGYSAEAVRHVEVYECSPGKFTYHKIYVSEGYSDLVCMDCQPGQFSAEPAASACATCDAGQFSVVSSSLCQRCPKGKYHPGGAAWAFCLDCERGRYASWIGATNCDHCPSGKFQDVSGYKHCNYCPVGKWTEYNVGMTNCTFVATAAPTPIPPAPTPPPTTGEHKECRNGPLNALGATLVPDGWTGPGFGDDYCKKCVCFDGQLMCTIVDPDMQECGVPKVGKECTHIHCKYDATKARACRFHTDRSHPQSQAVVGATDRDKYKAGCAMEIFHHHAETAGIQHHCAYNQASHKCTCHCHTALPKIWDDMRRHVAPLYTGERAQEITYGSAHHNGIVDRSAQVQQAAAGAV